MQQGVKIDRGSRLLGKRILLVEDDALIAMAMEHLLSENGATVVGPVGILDDAMTIADAGELDCAVLDVTLGKVSVYAVADCLATRGVPFAFLSGHDAENIAECHSDRPCLSKPCNDEHLLRVIVHLVGNA